MFNNLNWLFGSSNGGLTPISPNTKNPKSGSPATKKPAETPKPLTSGEIANIINNNSYTFGNNPNPYLTPSAGYQLGYVPSDGGAGYMWTPTERAVEDIYGGGGYYRRRGRGGGGGRKPVNWREAYTVEGAPEWWRGLLPNQFNAQSTYAALYNAMIPFLSPEDQRTVAQHLGGLYSKRPMWQTYNPETTDFAKPPVELTPEMMEQFTSSDRAKKALQTLDKVASISGKKKGFGAGYTFLRQLLKTMQDFGGGAVGAGNRQSRVQYQQMQSALDPLLASMKNTEFAGLAQQLTAPFFTAGRVVPISKDVTGRYVFGSPNKQLFG